jgi:tRNA threonylcarbamoyladenosine biosynthesis protein TsaB
VCSVALARGDAVDIRTLEVGQRHSEHLLPMIDALLNAQGLGLADCDAIAFGAGPGSFTGLRIACGVAQGLAYGARRPVIPISNLAALAWKAAQTEASIRRVLAAVDARMNETYWAVYDIDGDRAQEVMPPALADPPALVALAEHHAVDAIAGDALIAFAESLRSCACRRIAEARADAAAIVTLARLAFADGAALAPALATPIYVRDKVALTIDERHSLRAASEAS